MNGATLAQIWCKITASNDWLSQSICLANLAVQGAQQNAAAPAQPIAAVARPRWIRKPRLLAGSSSPRSRSLLRSTLARAYFRTAANPRKRSNHGCDSSCNLSAPRSEDSPRMADDHHPGSIGAYRTNQQRGDRPLTLLSLFPWFRPPPSSHRKRRSAKHNSLNSGSMRSN